MWSSRDPEPSIKRKKDQIWSSRDLKPSTKQKEGSDLILEGHLLTELKSKESFQTTIKHICKDTQFSRRMVKLSIQSPPKKCENFVSLKKKKEKKMSTLNFIVIWWLQNTGAFILEKIKQSKHQKQWSLCPDLESAHSQASSYTRNHLKEPPLAPQHKPWNFRIPRDLFEKLRRYLQRQIGASG